MDDRLYIHIENVLAVTTAYVFLLSVSVWALMVYKIDTPLTVNAVKVLHTTWYLFAITNDIKGIIEWLSRKN